MSHEQTLNHLRACFGTDVVAVSEFRDNVCVQVPADRAYEVLEFLKTECGFDYLAELTAADYRDYRGARDRYGVVYGLVSTETGGRLIVKVMLNDPQPRLPSVVPLWKGADWLEREVYDLFGIRFDGHPDLRRLLMPEEFTAYPLRKDYPLRGRGERHNFPVIDREERVLAPRQ